MKSAKLTCIISVALFTLVTIPTCITAQQYPADDLSSLPLDAQASVFAALGRDIPEYRAQARNGDFRAENPQNNLAAEFTSQGVAVRGESVFWKMTLRGYGYGIVLTPLQAVVPRAKLNRIEYRRGC